MGPDWKTLIRLHNKANSSYLEGSALHITISKRSAPGQSIKMNEKIKFLEEYLEYATARTPWDLGNQVLYDLCAKYPKHENDSQIIAKIWLIGRSYAASIERRKNKGKDDKEEELFYENIVAPAIRKSELDAYLVKIRRKKKIENSVSDILQTHKYLVDVFQRITKLNKRSLASKYLHFHCPRLFYIYDSRAAESLNQLIKTRTKKEKSINCDSQYASFVRKALILSKYIEENYNKHLTPRELDKIFLCIHERH